MTLLLKRMYVGLAIAVLAMNQFKRFLIGGKTEHWNMLLSANLIEIPKYFLSTLL